MYYKLIKYIFFEINLYSIYMFIDKHIFGIILIVEQ